MKIQEIQINYDAYCKGTPCRRQEASRDIMETKGKSANINAIRMSDIGRHQQLIAKVSLV